MKVRLTGPAEVDLERLANVIAQTDAQRAKGTVERVMSAARGVGRAPLRSPAVPGNPRLRKKSVPPFLLLFEVRRDHVLIVRIVHERSDWASLA